MKFILGFLIILCSTLSVAQETRNFRHLVILVSFTDYVYSNPSEELANAKENIKKLETYYDTVTRGAIHLDHNLLGDGEPFVFEAQLGIPSERSCQLKLFRSLAIQQVKSAHPEIKDWDRLMLLFPFKSICVGTGWVGLAGGGNTYLKSHSLGVMIHEVGHNFGLGHIKDSADPMGGGSSGFSPIQLYTRGWFGDCTACHIDIDPKQATTITMAPLYVASLDDKPVITARIRENEDAPLKENAFFSYRTNEPWFDSRLPSKSTQGVRINRKGVYPYTLRDGEYYYLDDWNITIYQHSHNKDQVKFDVIPGRVCDPLAESSEWTHGDGTLENPYVICNAAQLQKLGADSTLWKSSFRLGANLSMNNAVLTPIGSFKRPFLGNFDGGLYTLSNFQTIGLFGVTQGADIKNLILQQAHILPSEITGSLAQIARQTNFQSIASLEISGPNSTKYTGGLVGRMVKSTINGCKVDGEIELASPSILLGGVVGSMEKSSISNCASRLTFSPTSPSANQIIVGGIIGGAKDSQCNHSYAQFNVTKDNITVMPFVSGIAGQFLSSSMNYVLYTGLYKSDEGAELFYPISQSPIDSRFEKVFFYSKGQQNIGEYRELNAFKDGTLLQTDFEGNLNWTQKKNQLPNLAIESDLEPELEIDEPDPELPD